ncbi:MAG TPA: DUF3043 domain-containing protein [Jatrophihabitantaceae bacterium]|nr:DUF3043 domain-containing protein [Jatrophihabitantaceae bacterium]
MKLRRSGSDDPVPAVPTPTVETVDAPWGKGRATPKRRDVAPKRQPMSAPRTTKEANKLRKQQRSQPRPGAKAAKPLTTKEYREALKRGDPSALGSRDRGPVRLLTRNWVDSHRMASNYLIILLPLLIIGSKVPFVSVATLVIFIGFLAEWYITGRRIRAIALSRQEDVREGPWTLGFYAGTRAYLPRRFRVPRPTVSLGDQI